jgi:hypothetical protein
VEDLKSEVESLFKVEYKYQNLFVNGKPVMFGTLNESGVKDRDTIVVVSSFDNFLKHYLFYSYKVATFIT